MSFIGRHIGDITNSNNIKKMLSKCNVKSVDQLIKNTNIKENFRLDTNLKNTNISNAINKNTNIPRLTEEQGC